MAAPRKNANNGKAKLIHDLKECSFAPLYIITGDEDYMKAHYLRQLKELSLIHISEPTRQAEISYAVFCLKKFFFNDTATTEIYTLHIVGSVRCV